MTEVPVDTTIDLHSSEAGSAPGVTRFDLPCHSRVVGTVLAQTRRWASDRALPDLACTRLSLLTCAAMRHGLRFDPQAVTLLLRWSDPDRVRLDVRWRGCSSTARTDAGGREVRTTIATLDALAAEWGVEPVPSGWVLWMVADAADSPPLIRRSWDQAAERSQLREPVGQEVDVVVGGHGTTREDPIWPWHLDPLSIGDQHDRSHARRGRDGEHDLTHGQRQPLSAQ